MLYAHNPAAAIFAAGRGLRLWLVPNRGHATLHKPADECNRKAKEFFRAKFPTATTP